MQTHWYDCLLSSVVLTVFLTIRSEAAPFPMKNASWKLPRLESLEQLQHSRSALETRHNILQYSGIESLNPETRRVLMTNGTAEDVLIFVFTPEVGKHSDEYEFRFFSSNQEIINSEADISFSQINSGHRTNVTVVLEFDKFPGAVTVTMDAIRKTNETRVDSTSIDYIAAGLVVFIGSTRTLVSGTSRMFTISDYREIYNLQHWELAVFVQYLNGSDSSQVPTTSGKDLSLQFSDVDAIISENTGLIRWDDSSCSMSDAKWNGTGVTLSPGCGVGITEVPSNATQQGEIRFALDVERNRAGEMTIHILWDGFTAETEFEDEQFTTFVTLRIGGQPPAVVRRIDPGNPFDKAGGERLYVEMINTADATVTSFNVAGQEFPVIEGSRGIKSGPEDFYETMAFLTKPGIGKTLPWTISATRKERSPQGEGIVKTVIVIDETGFQFSYNEGGIVLTSISPKQFPEAGGACVVHGNLTVFDLDDPSHRIAIGNVLVAKKYIGDVSTTNMSLTIPPRENIGNAWKYGVSVQIGTFQSRALMFVYEPSSIQVNKQVFGASSDPGSNISTVSTCGDTTFTAMTDTHFDPEVTYKWTLLGTQKEKILVLSSTEGVMYNGPTIAVPNQLFGEAGVLYTVRADIAVGNKSITGDFLVKKSREAVLGVAIVQPENRTISYPEANLRVVASIDVPSCYTTPAGLRFEWKYEDKSNTLLAAGRAGIAPSSVHDAKLNPEFDDFVFSFKNRTGTSPRSITPTRLGRELIIPRELLQHGLHRIRLTVRDTNGSTLLGMAHTTIHVNESPLRAVIGTGQVTRRASDAQDLYVSAQGSNDPDSVSRYNSQEGLTYLWNCSFSAFENFTESDACEESLMPQKNEMDPLFVVRASSLQKKTAFSRDEEISGYIRYNLQVMKGNRRSFSSQVVGIVASGGRKLANYDRIEVANSRGEAVNLEAVEFWEDVIIRPVASGGTNWRFRLEEPRAERSLFFAGDAKLISSPGYYISGGRNEPGFQSVPLGIAADHLEPHQTYVFSILLQQRDRVTEEVTVRLKTMEFPDLVFPPIYSKKGEMNSTFLAMATTSFPADSSYTFQFYLIDYSARTKEYCVDGCTGANVARFQVAKPGRYVLQCRLYSRNGRKLLAVRNNTSLVSVEANVFTTSVEAYDLEMHRSYTLGDDGAVNQRGFYATHSMQEDRSEVVALSDEPGDERCSKYTKKWVNLSRAIVNNELPNAPNTRNYVSMASNYAQLKCVEDEDTLYGLLALVHQSITRTPKGEVLSTQSYTAAKDLPDVALQKELIAFYNHSMTRALSTIASGTTRIRLVQEAGQVNNLLLDLSEMWMKHVTTIATSSRVCGWDATYTSNAANGDPGTALGPRDTQAQFGVNTIRVAVMCNREQGNSLTTPHARFQWCDSVYDQTAGARKLVTLAESYDYPYLSGIQGLNKSDTRRLVMVDITTLDESNQLVSAMSDSAVLAQAEDDTDAPDSCYTVSLSMSPQVMARTAGHCSSNVAYHMWPRKRYGQLLLRQFDQDAYLRRTQGISVTDETQNDSSEVVAKSNILGLYGAYREPCYPSDTSLTGTGLTLVFILLGILLAVLVVTAITYKTVVVMVTEAPEDDLLGGVTYVERDFFGRGQIRINVITDDEDPGSLSEIEPDWYGGSSTRTATNASTRTLNAPSRQGDSDEVLDGFDPNLPNHSAILASTHTTLPTKPHS